MSAALSRTLVSTGLIACFAAAAAGQVRIVQTNSLGDNISFIDPATNQVVAEVKVVPINHGAAASTSASSHRLAPSTSSARRRWRGSAVSRPRAASTMFT